MVDIDFSVSTNSDGSSETDTSSPVDLSDVPDPDAVDTDSGSDGFDSPESDGDSMVDKIHEKDDHRATDLHEAEYKTGYADLAADFLRAYRLYLLALVVAGSIFLWRFGSFPRWTYFAVGSAAASLLLTWSFVFNQVQKLDDDIDNVAIEVAPDDSAETHGYIVGDGALPEFESKNSVPPYPQQGTEADVYEVDTLEVDTLEYDGPLRASLPYSEYVDLQYARDYHRENIVPLADKVPKLNAQLEAASLKGGIDRGIDMAETLEDALSGDLETPDYGEDVDIDDIAGHAQEVEQLREEQQSDSEVSADD